MDRKIIKQGKMVRTGQLDLFWELVDCPGAGISCRIDDNGVIDYSHAGEAAIDNLVTCIEGDSAYQLPVLRTIVSRYWDPTIIKCDCGKPVTLHDTLVNTCGCGRDYSGTGQLLAPRSTWDPAPDADELFDYSG